MIDYIKKIEEEYEIVDSIFLKKVKEILVLHEELLQIYEFLLKIEVNIERCISLVKILKLHNLGIEEFDSEASYDDIRSIVKRKHLEIKKQMYNVFKVDCDDIMIRDLKNLITLDESFQTDLLWMKENIEKNNFSAEYEYELLKECLWEELVAINKVKKKMGM